MIKRNPVHGFFIYVVFRGRFYCVGNRQAALAAAIEDGEL